MSYKDVEDELNFLFYCQNKIKQKNLHETNWGKYIARFEYWYILLSTIYIIYVFTSVQCKTFLYKLSAFPHISVNMLPRSKHKKAHTV